VTSPEARAAYEEAARTTAAWVVDTNEKMRAAGHPVRIDHLTTIWTCIFTRPSRFHWLFQYYLRDEGLALSWVGTGRCLFSLDWTEADYDELLKRMLNACSMMKSGGWWEPPRKSIKMSMNVEFATAILKSLIGL